MKKFGNYWRAAGLGLWEGMAKRSDGLQTTQVIGREVRDRASMIEIGCGAGHVALECSKAGFQGETIGVATSRKWLWTLRVKNSAPQLF